MAKTVIGIFQNRQDAEDAIDELRDRDYNPKDISIVMRNHDEAIRVADNTGADVASGAATGVTTGAVVGGLAGLLAAVALPGLGAFLIGGPIAAALGLTGAAASTVSGAATGAVAGGLLGALTGLGLSEDDARIYQDYVNQGGILVAVPARRGEEIEVRDVFEDYDADQIRTISPREEKLSDYDASDRDESYERGSFYAGAKGGRRSHDHETHEEHKRHSHRK